MGVCQKPFWRLRGKRAKPIGKRQAAPNAVASRSALHRALGPYADRQSTF